MSAHQHHLTRIVFLLTSNINEHSQGEMLPMQGGHNDKVAHQMHAALSSAGRQHLHWYWYVAKDQTRPIPAIQKKRSCHIKLMIVDETIGIVGSGNQDTQSVSNFQSYFLLFLVT